MYYLSILAIFKNETMGLKLWIEHYLWQGVDHFYLIDNGSTDNPLDILQTYIDNGIVTYVSLPERHKQSEHYRYVFDKFNLKRNTFWLAICDLDEYYYGVDNLLTKKLKSLENCFDYILCNWIMFGSNGNEKQPEDIRVALTKCAKEMSTYTKYIFKTNAIRSSASIWVHNLLDVPYIPLKRIRVANKLIRLNHYPTQSLEYFTTVKMTRGDSYWPSCDNIRDMDYFKRYEFNDIEDNTLKNLVLNRNAGIEISQTNDENS